jgi:hypothetical protein
MAALPPVLAVPGLNDWLGVNRTDDEPDEYEALCQQLSKETT